MPAHMPRRCRSRHQSPLRFSRRGRWCWHRWCSRRAWVRKSCWKDVTLRGRWRDVHEIAALSLALYIPASGHSWLSARDRRTPQTRPLRGRAGGRGGTEIANVATSPMSHQLVVCHNGHSTSEWLRYPMMMMAAGLLITAQVHTHFGHFCHWRRGCHVLRSRLWPRGPAGRSVRRLWECTD